MALLLVISLNKQTKVGGGIAGYQANCEATPTKELGDTPLWADELWTRFCENIVGCVRNAAPARRSSLNRDFGLSLHPY